MKGENSFTDFTPVSDDDAAREHLLMNLRLSEGLDLAAYEARWNTRPSCRQNRATDRAGSADSG